MTRDEYRTACALLKRLVDDGWRLAADGLRRQGERGMAERRAYEHASQIAQAKDIATDLVEELPPRRGRKEETYGR